MLESAFAEWKLNFLEPQCGRQTERINNKLYKMYFLVQYVIHVHISITFNNKIIQLNKFMYLCSFYGINNINNTM